ncbi:MAG TPA: hypothetical protein VJ301_10090 [Propionibacteriaceae bacterium]|nr:hypothetical protein [Propionibacteriaceae bacterium]
MGFLDELKDKAEEFGKKAQEGFGAGKDKTEEVIENVKDRFDGDDASATAQDSAESIEQSAVAATEAQKFAPSMGEAVGATETAASSVDEAVGAQEAAGDRRADSR